ncbi:MAG: hypothetical protein ACLFPS_08615 [Clostridia bacterium]
MREIINRIKRGELQLYLSLVETYVSLVYFSARDTYTEDEAINLTKEIFTQLYDKVLNYIFIYDAQNYIDNNLEKISSKKDVSLKRKYFDDARDVPEILIRKILVEISAKSNSKKRRSILIAAPIMALIFIVGITFISQVSSSNDTHPKGTIRGVEDQVEKVYEERYNISYNSNDKMIKIINFSRLDNERILVEKIHDKSYIYEIYKEDELIDSFLSAEDKMQFLTLTNEGHFIFKVNEELVKYNENFEEIEKFKLPSSLYKYSENNRFALYRLNDEIVLMDLFNFNEKIISLEEDKVIKVNNDGTLVTEKDLVEKGYQKVIDDNSLRYEIIDNQIITLSELGILKVMEDGSRVFAKKLAHYEDLELTQTYDHKPHMRTTLNYNEDSIIVSIRSRSNSNFEIYDRKSGDLITALADTLRSGDQVPKPMLSSNGDAFLLATQYKTRRQAIRFNAVYDLSTQPIHEHQLPGVGHIEVMDIIGSDDIYYVYTFDDNGYFRIYKVEFVNN